MRKLFPAIIGLATALGIASACAQTYPSRPITMLVPFAAGGPADALARALGADYGVEVHGRTVRARAIGDAIVEVAGEIGGVIVFGFNIVSKAQLTSLTTTLQAAATDGGQPRLLIAVDQDGVACHTGRRSCFFHAWRDGHWAIIAEPLVAPETLYPEPRD